MATKDAGNWTFAGILKVYCGNLTKFLAAEGEMVNVWFDDMEIWNSFPHETAAASGAAGFAADSNHSGAPVYKLTLWSGHQGRGLCRGTRGSYDLRGRALPIHALIPAGRERVDRKAATHAVIIQQPR